MVLGKQIEQEQMQQQGESDKPRQKSALPAIKVHKSLKS